jgi:hypothetical protein
VTFPAPKPPAALELPKFQRWIRLQDCIVPGCTELWIQACHFRNRRMHGDAANLFPACEKHHIEDQHQHGVETFQRAHGLDLAEACLRYWDRFLHGDPFLLDDEALALRDGPQVIDLTAALVDSLKRGTDQTPRNDLDTSQ